MTTPEWMEHVEDGPEEFARRLNLAISVLLRHQNLGEIARLFQVEPSTLYRWRRGAQAPRHQQRIRAEHVIAKALRSLGPDVENGGGPFPVRFNGTSLRWARLTWGLSRQIAARETGVPEEVFSAIESGEPVQLSESHLAMLVGFITGAERIAGEPAPGG